MGTPHYPSMRIVRKDLIPNGPRSVKMIPVDSDDLWFAYNLVAGKDPFLAITLRKVVRQTKSGGKDAEWVKLKSEIWWPSLSMTITRSRIETSIPRKHGPAVARYVWTLNKFFESVLHAFLKHVDFNVLRCAETSPGFTENQCHLHLLLEAE
ncbi:protein PELOTA 1 [Citrus sinensis]|nr:protein PELOTA 1 [Citrus sinensis]